VSDLAYQGGNLVTIWAVCGILVATFIVGVFVNIVTAWQFIEMPEAMVLRSLLSRVGH
jgi:hypothetical protein